MVKAPIRAAFAALLALAAAAAAATAPAAAGTLDRIKESGEIRLGVRTDAAPHSFVNADGAHVGYTVQVCNAVVANMASRLGLSVRHVYVPVDATDRFDAVAAGRIDLLCGAASVTLTRREKVDFSLPTFVDGAAVLLPANQSPDFAALAGKRIGVRAGSTTEESLKATLASNAMQAEMVSVASHASGLAALEKGEIDAYFGDQSILYNLFFSSSFKDRLRVSANTMTIEKHALALARGDADFRLEVDRSLSALYRSGQMVEFFGEAFPGADISPGLAALFALAPERR